MSAIYGISVYIACSKADKYPLNPLRVATNWKFLTKNNKNDEQGIVQPAVLCKLMQEWSEILSIWIKYVSINTGIYYSQQERNDKVIDN